MASEILGKDSPQKKDLIRECLYNGFSYLKPENKNIEDLKEMLKNPVVSLDRNEYLGDKKIKYIIHLSDLHFRSSVDYRVKYIDVLKKFEKFFETFEGKEESIIVITGDIFHETGNLNREERMMFNKYMKSMSEHCKVFLIDGNHDTKRYCGKSKINTNLIDSKLKMDKNLVYLEKSGSYLVGDNVNLVVLNFFEYNPFFLDRLLKQSVKKDKVNILLYHGDLINILKEEKKRPGFFYTFSKEDYQKIIENFDFVLVGDIHKYNLLEKNCAYPGSLIQQNYGEDPTNHGFIVWNLEERTSSFQVINPCEIYTTINLCSKGEIMSNDIEKIRGDKELLKGLKKISVKTKCLPPFTLTGKTEEEYIKEKLPYLQEEFENTTFIFKKIETDSQNINQTLKITSEEEQEDLGSSSIFRTFIEDNREFLLKKIKGIDEISTESLHSLHSSKILEFQEYFSKTDKKPVDIKSVSFYGIAGCNNIKECKIDFSQNKLTCISGENASGKTSIFNVFAYLINNEPTFEKFLNKDSEKFYASMIFKIENKEYRLTKSGEVSKKTKELITLERLKGSSSKPLSCQDKREIRRNLKSLLGEYKIFEKINKLDKSVSSNIIDTKSGGIFDIMSISCYSEGYKKIEESCKETIKEYKSLKNKCETRIEGKEKEIESKDGPVDKLQGEISLLKKDIKEIEKKIQVEEEKLEKIFTEKGIEEGKKQEGFDYRLYKTEEKKSITEEERRRIFEELKESLCSCQLSKEQVPCDKECYKILEESIINSKEEISRLETNYNLLKSTENPPYNEERYNKSKESIERKINLEDNIKNLKNAPIDKEGNKLLSEKDFKEVLNVFENLNSIIEDTKRDFEVITKYEEWINKEKPRRETYQKLQESKKILKAITKSRDNILNDIYNFKSISNFLMYRDYGEKVSKLKKEEQTTKSILRDLKETLKRHVDKISKKEKCIEDIKECEKEIEALKIEQEENSLKLRLNEVYQASLSKKYFQRYLLENQVKSLTLMTNSVIQGFNLNFNLKSQLEEGENSSLKLDFSIVRGKKEYSKESLSGYESLVLNCILKIATRQLISNKCPIINLFCMDEGFDSIDSNNIKECLPKLLQTLKDSFSNVFYITHNKDVKDFSERRLEVVRDSGFFSIKED